MNKLLTSLTVGTFALTLPILAEETQQAIPKPEAKTQDPQQREQIEVCFVLDTTGSMSGLLQGAKHKIWEIANELAKRESKPIIKFSLIGYRDRGDQYVTKVSQLTDDLDLIHKDLMGFAAGGGGDQPESVNQALHESLNRIQWAEDKNVKKIVFLVGDAPPHMDYQQDTPYTKTCGDALQRNIIINTIQCGSIQSCTSYWKDIAMLAKGQYVALPQDGGVVAIKAPQDQQIAELTIKIYESGIAYGDKKQRTSAVSKQSNAKALAQSDYSSNAWRNSCQNIHGAGVARAWSGNDDLVTEWGNKSINLTNLNKEHLPEEWKKLSDEALVKEIETRLQQREAIQKKINTLQIERTAFLKDAKSNLAKSELEQSFDEQVEKLLTQQLGE